jgi:hypothetical protein
MESTSKIEKEDVTIVRYSSEDPVYNYDSYESLKSQEASTFPTCVIITIGHCASLNSPTMAVTLTLFLASTEEIQGESFVDSRRM